MATQPQVKTGEELERELTGLLDVERFEASEEFRRNALITVRPSVEDIQEFKMQTNLFGAEQGRSSGATVNVITKSGTNNYHGSAFEYIRNNDLDARNFFNTVGNAKTPRELEQWGVTAGGPIVKDKVFFFGAYEGQIYDVGNTFSVTTPTTVPITRCTPKKRRSCSASFASTSMRGARGMPLPPC